MKTINLSCPITPHTGYGVTSFNILKSLLSLGYNIDLFPIGNPQVQSQEDKNIIVDLINRANHLYSKNNPFLKIWHQFDLATRIGATKYGALVFFEIDKMNPIEINAMNNTDCIFVASKWAKKVLEDNNITTKIIVSPLAVDTDIFQTSSSTKENDSTYRFINIGKWEIRKGHDILVEAFNSAFTEKDDVELWMMNHNPFLNEDQNLAWQKLYSSSKLKNKIKFIPRVNTHKEVSHIIEQTDCGIFPARAEGWNNEILEVMAMDKPVITTNYSAHTEYCTTDNSYLIDIDKLVPAKDDHFFTNGFGKWAELGNKQIEQMVEHMRYVYTNNIRSNKNGLSTVKQYTWDNTANIISQELFN
jgi:glycosyltransferase involved in cell wall biosynthesis